MDRLTRYVTHHRKIVIGIWVLLTAFGGFAAGQMTDRWLKTFSIPGYSAYEANQRMIHAHNETSEKAIQALGNPNS